MQQFAEIVKTATTFLVLIATMIGIPVAFYSLQKAKLEVRKLRGEIQKLELNDPSNKSDSDQSNNRTNQRAKRKHSEPQYDSLYLAINVLSITASSVLLTALISPVLAPLLPADFVEKGWPGGKIGDAISRSAYGLLPNFAGIIAGAAYRRARMMKQKWFRGRKFASPSMHLYAAAGALGYLAGFIALVGLSVAEVSYYGAAWGSYQLKLCVYNAALPTISVLFFCLYLDSSYVLGRKMYKIGLSSAYLLTNIVFTFVISYIIYNQPAWPEALTGVIWFKTLQMALFALCFVLALVLLTPTSLLQRPASGVGRMSSMP